LQITIEKKKKKRKEKKEKRGNFELKANQSVARMSQVNTCVKKWWVKVKS
jgi:hypothetical protein